MLQVRLQGSFNILQCTEDSLLLYFLDQLYSLFHIKPTKKGFRGIKTQFLELKENVRDLANDVGWIKRNWRTFEPLIEQQLSNRREESS